MVDSTNYSLDDSVPSFNNPELLAEIAKVEDDDRLMVKGAAQGALNPDLFTSEQINKGVPEAISGNRKDYSWDTMINDDKFINIMKNFYETRDGAKFNYQDGDTQEENDLRNKQDVVDYFVWDRTWKGTNVFSIGKELVEVKKLSKETDDPKKNKKNLEQLQRLYYGMNYWNSLPWFKDRSAWDVIKATGRNLYTGTMDATNLGSLGVGMLATKTVGRKALAQTAQFTVGQYLKKYAGRTITPMVAFDVAAMGTADIMSQNTQIEMGIKDNINPYQTGAVMVVAGGVSLPISSVAGFYGTRYSLMTQRKIPANTLIQSAEKKVSSEPLTGDKKISMFTGYQQSIGMIFDRLNPVKVIQKKVTGVGGSVLDAKKVVQSKPTGVFKDNQGFTTIIDNDVIYGPARDVGSLGYYSLRTVVGGTNRAKFSADSEMGVYMLPDIGDLNYYYKQTGNPGFNVILSPFVKEGEGENFLMYIAAKRALRMHDLNRTSPEGFIPFIKDPLEKDRKFLNIPFTREEAQAIIDRAEMTPEAYKAAYNIELDRTQGLNFINAATQWKAYTDDLIDNQVRGGILSYEQGATLKATYETGYIPFYKKVSTEKVTNNARANNINGIGSPATKQTTRGPVGKEVEDGDKEVVKLHSLYDNVIDYHFNAIVSADKNRAKVLYYQNINQGIKNGTFEQITISKKKKTKTQTFTESEVDLETKSIKEGLTTKTIFGIDEDILMPNGLITYNGIPIMQKISPTEIKNKTILTDSIIKQLKKNGYKIDESEIIQDNINLQGATFTSVLRDGDDIIDVVYYNGKPNFFRILDPGLVGMYNNAPGREFFANHPVLGKMYQGLTMATSIPSKMITLSPRFAGANIFRDTFTATVNSAFGFIPIWSTMKGLILTNKGIGSLTEQKAWHKKLTGMFDRSLIYNEFLTNGGGMSGRNSNQKLFMPKWEKFTDATGHATKDYKISANYFKKVFSNGAEGYVEFISRLEYASRLAEYSYARKTGFSPVMSAFTGREVSTDFAMHGNSKFLQAYSENTMFFNAGLQGFYKMIRSVKDNPVKAGVIAGGVFVAPEIAMWTMLNGREEYEELSNEVKLMNYVYPIFKDGETDANGELSIDHFILIPKPFDYQFAPNTAIAILEAVKKNDIGGGLEYTLHSFQKIMPGFTTPTALNPIVSVLANQSWQGDKIVPDYMLSQIPEAQKTGGTRLTAQKMVDGIKWLTGQGYALAGKEGLEAPTVSPIKVDFMLNSYMAGVGQIALDLSDAFFYEGSDTLGYSGKRYEYTEAGDKIDILGEKPKARGDRIDIINDPASFVTSRFKIETPIKNNARVNLFFDKVNRLKKLETLYPSPENDRYLINNYVEILTGDAQHRLENESKEIIELRQISPFLEAGLEVARIVRDEKKVITQNPNLSGEEKSEQIAKQDALLAEAVRIILSDIRSTDFETFDQTLFANPDMTAENVNLGNTRKILEQSTDEINNAVSKAIEQSKELFN